MGLLGTLGKIRKMVEMGEIRKMGKMGKIRKMEEMGEIRKMRLPLVFLVPLVLLLASPQSPIPNPLSPNHRHHST